MSLRFAFYSMYQNVPLLDYSNGSDFRICFPKCLQESAGGWSIRDCSEQIKTFLKPPDNRQYCVASSAEIKPNFPIAGAALHPPRCQRGKGWRLWGIFHCPKTWMYSGPLQLLSFGCQLWSRKAEHWEEGCAEGVHSISVPVSPWSLVWDEDGSHWVTTAGDKQNHYCPVAMLSLFWEMLLSTAPSGCLLLPSSEKPWYYNGEGIFVSLGGSRYHPTAKKTSEKVCLWWAPPAPSTQPALISGAENIQFKTPFEWFLKVHRWFLGFF